MTVIASPTRSSRELFLWAGPEVTLVISHVERRHWCSANPASADQPWFSQEPFWLVYRMRPRDHHVIESSWWSNKKDKRGRAWAKNGSVKLDKTGVSCILSTLAGGPIRSRFICFGDRYFGPRSISSIEQHLSDLQLSHWLGRIDFHSTIPLEHFLRFWGSEDVP